MNSDTGVYFRELIYSKSCCRSEITLTTDVDRFIFTGLTYELKTLSNVLFYLIFSDKCSILKIRHFPDYNNLIDFDHLEREKCNKLCYNDKCLIAKFYFHCCYDLFHVISCKKGVSISWVQLQLPQGSCCYPGLLKQRT